MTHRTSARPSRSRRPQGRRSVPATVVTGRAAGAIIRAEGVPEERVVRLREPSGGGLARERLYPASGPAEFVRGRAQAELDAGPGPRLPRDGHVLTLPEGVEITLRDADLADLDAARAMHARCSERTLSLRYHGPVRDADRYLDHLLSPRFGRALAARTASGRLVALGHLLPDGDEAEVAVLVEDEWQRRGIGSELLGRLVALASEAGYENVYVVTRASDTGLAAIMRALNLPLGQRIEEGTRVLTARLAPAPAPALVPAPARSLPSSGPAGH